MDDVAADGSFGSELWPSRAKPEICMNETHALPENCLVIRSRDDLIETPLAGAEEGVN